MTTLDWRLSPHKWWVLHDDAVAWHARAMLLLTRRMQYAIKRCLGGHVTTLVSQLWHDLAGWQMRIGFAVAQRHDALALKLAERVTRYRPERRRASICQDFFW